MADGPAVSLYVPAYNVAGTLAACLEAVLAQTLPPAEILVIDDGSTDGTASVARSFPVSLLPQPGNLGLAAARNRGLKQAAHELVASLDADCVPDPAGWRGSRRCSTTRGWRLPEAA